MAKPFFINFMRKIEESKKVNYDRFAKFYRPPGPLGIELDCGQYQTDDLDVEGEFEKDDMKEDQFGDEVGEDPFGTGGNN